LLLQALSPNTALFVSKILGALLGICVVCKCEKLGRLLFPQSRWVGGIAALVLVVQPTFTLSMINGLETSFATFFLTYGVAELTAACVQTGEFRLRRTALYFLLAAFSRPELTLTFPILLILYEVHRRTPVRKETAPPSVSSPIQPENTRIGSASEAWLIYVLPVCALLLFRYRYYGDLLPNTYYAKQIPLHSAVSFGIEYFLRFGLLGHNLLGLLLLAFGIGHLITSRLRTAWPLLTTTSIHVAFVMKCGGDWMPDGRFYAVIAPLVAVIFAAGMVELMAVSRRPNTAVSPEIVRIAFVSISAIFVLSVAADSLKQYQAFAHRPYLRSIVYALAPHRPYAQWMCTNEQGRLRMEAWVANHAHAGDSVLVSEMGLIPLMNLDVRFIDVCGLTDKTIAHMTGYLRGCGGINAQHQWMYPDGQMSKYIMKRRPALVILIWDANNESRMDGVNASNAYYRPAGCFPILTDNGPNFVATWMANGSRISAH
jgi:arabinofuranosyltransferase